MICDYNITQIIIGSLGLGFITGMIVTGLMIYLYGDKE